MDLKPIGLGTAMWGWSVDEKEAFRLLDHFYINGGRFIDTAMNYPINGNPNDKYRALKYIQSWVISNDIDDLNITCKIGSVVNYNSQENNLSRDYLDSVSDDLIDRLRNNLSTLMIHWDNRNNHNDIIKSLKCLQSTCLRNRLSLGVSGISNVEAYACAIDFLNIDKVEIQAKSSFLYSGESPYIDNFKCQMNIWAYGISGSGLKIDSKEYLKNSYISLVRDKNYHENFVSSKVYHVLVDLIKKESDIKNLYHVGVLRSECNPNLYGYLISPSKITQLFDILDFRKKLLNSKLIEKYQFFWRNLNEFL